MATITEASVQQGTYEVRKWTVDFTNDLPTSVTVSSGTAYHTPPSGTAQTVTVTASSPYVYAQIGTIATTGVHYLDVVATFSNAEVSQVRIAFTVGYPTPTARVGMLDMIDTLRGMTDAGVNDYTIAGVSYWSDAQLQKVMDRHREDVYQLQAAPITTMLGGGTVAYYTYYLNRVNIESGTAAFTLEDATGADIGTSAYTLDNTGGIVTFSTDTAGSSYYWTGRAYDLNASAADVWRMKAANAAKMFDFSTDNHSVKRSQFAAQCLQMANYYEAQATPVSILMYREDMTNDGADND